MRVLAGAQYRLVQTDLLQQLQHIGIHRRVTSAVGLNQCFGNLPADAQGRVEADHRVLRHQTDHAAANPTFFSLASVAQAVTIDVQLAACDGRVVWQQAEYGVGQGRLAGAGFADNRHGFAPGHLKRDAAHGLVGLAVEAVGDTQMTNVDQLSGIGHR